MERIFWRRNPSQVGEATQSAGGEAARGPLAWDFEPEPGRRAQRDGFLGAGVRVRFENQPLGLMGSDLGLVSRPRSLFLLQNPLRSRLVSRSGAGYSPRNSALMAVRVLVKWFAVG